MNGQITWNERVKDAADSLGRDLTFDELVALARTHEMTPGEVREQRISFVYGQLPHDNKLSRQEVADMVDGVHRVTSAPMTIERLDLEVSRAADRLLDTTVAAAKVWLSDISRFVDQSEHLPDHLVTAVITKYGAEIERRQAEEVEKLEREILK